MNEIKCVNLDNIIAFSAQEYKLLNYEKTGKPQNVLLNKKSEKAAWDGSTVYRQNYRDGKKDWWLPSYVAVTLAGYPVWRTSVSGR